MKHNLTTYLRRLAPVLLVLSVLRIATSPLPVMAHAPSALSLAARTFYVSTTGSDAAPGTIDQPWKTIQKAANTLQPGDTVLIRAGIYHERVQPQRSGLSGQEITYAAYPGETPVIDGSGIALPNTLAGLVQVDHQNYILIRGLTVANAGPNSENTAVLIQYSSNVTIRNVHTNGSVSSGILLWDSNHITVIGSIVENANQSGPHECLSVGLTYTFEVSYNEVFNCKKEGIDVKDGSYNGIVKHNHVHNVLKTGIYVDAWNKPTHDIILDGNLVHDSANQGIELASEQGGLLSNVYVYNNIVYHNQYVGVMISKNAAGGGPLTNLQIVNNTLANNGWVNWGGGIWMDNGAAQNVHICNNILSQNIYFQAIVSPNIPAANVYIDHNLVDGYRGHISEGETRGLSYYTGDPGFVGAAVGNYHIRSDSPARSGGALSCATLPIYDFDGQVRPTAVVGLGADVLIEYNDKMFLPFLIGQ